MRLTLVLIIWLETIVGHCQVLLDPCFISVEEPGFYYGSESLQNVCDCSNRHLASDLIEWNGTVWLGQEAPISVYLPPPEGCSRRAIFLGRAAWTPNGEGVALRLDRPLEEGKTYSYTFTYASDGVGSDGNFSPYIYTHSGPVDKRDVFKTGIRMGRLPGVDGWTTHTYTFTATDLQAGHEWLILHAVESSGIILSNCVPQPVGGGMIEGDTIFCVGDSVVLRAPGGPYAGYLWSNSETTEAIKVGSPGKYSVVISLDGCDTEDEILLELADCEVRLVMPNIFTPDQDGFNEQFVPKEANFIDEGWIRIFNRWGLEIFHSDLFTGWDGFTGTAAASVGVYYYEVMFMDLRGGKHYRRGTVTLAR
jgi:gliding motility-associated-like protein